MPSVTSGLSFLFPHPPLATLVRQASAFNPYQGEGEFDRTELGGFGLIWTARYVPPGIGYEDGYIYKYEQRLFQLSIEHDLLLGTGTVTTQIEESAMGDGLFWYLNALPSHIHYYIFPFVQIDFFNLYV